MKYQAKSGSKSKRKSRNGTRGRGSSSGPLLHDELLVRQRDIGDDGDGPNAPFELLFGGTGPRIAAWRMPGASVRLSYLSEGEPPSSRVLEALEDHATKRHFEGLLNEQGVDRAAFPISALDRVVATSV